MTTPPPTWPRSGCPASWASYAGDSFWAPRSVYHDPLYPLYVNRLTDANLARFLLTHPADAIAIGERSANDALQVRVDYLGSYAPADRPSERFPGEPGHRADQSRAGDPGRARAGLAAAAVGSDGGDRYLGAADRAPVRPVAPGRRVRDLHADRVRGRGLRAAAYFAGVETTRHMLGSNLATALAFALAAILLASMVRHGITAGGAGDHASSEVLAAIPQQPGPPEPGPVRRASRRGAASSGLRSGVCDEGRRRPEAPRRRSGKRERAGRARRRLD